MSCCQSSSSGKAYPAFLLALFLTVLALASWVLEPRTASGSTVSDSSQVLTAVSAFHRALEMGDRGGALDLLSSEAVIAENGRVETSSEYASHHLEADMAFAAAVDRIPALVRIVVADSSAWVMSTTETRGMYRGKQVESQGAETVVLQKGEEGWKISAIHWSSREG